MAGNWSKVVCGHSATVAMLLMYQSSALAEGAESGLGVFRDLHQPSTLDFGAIWHAGAGAVQFTL